MTLNSAFGPVTELKTEIETQKPKLESRFEKPKYQKGVSKTKNGKGVSKTRIAKGGTQNKKPGTGYRKQESHIGDLIFDTLYRGVINR